MHSSEKKREAYNKKTLEIERFFFTGIQNHLIGIALRMRSIVGCQFERPDVLLEGLFAVGQILLCEVGLLVGCTAVLWSVSSLISRIWLVNGSYLARDWLVIGSSLACRS